MGFRSMGQNLYTRIIRLPHIPKDHPKIENRCLVGLIIFRSDFHRVLKLAHTEEILR